MDSGAAGESAGAQAECRERLKARYPGRVGSASDDTLVAAASARDAVWVAMVVDEDGCAGASPVERGSAVIRIDGRSGETLVAGVPGAYARFPVVGLVASDTGVAALSVYLPPFEKFEEAAGKLLLFSVHGTLLRTRDYLFYPGPAALSRRGTLAFWDGDPSGLPEMHNHEQRLVVENADGSARWTRAFPYWTNEGRLVVKAMAFDDRENLIVVGNTRGRLVLDGAQVGGDYSSPIVVSFSPEGSINWVRAETGLSGWFSAVAVGPGGRIAAVGAFNYGRDAEGAPGLENSCVPTTQPCPQNPFFFAFDRDGRRQFAVPVESSAVSFDSFIAVTKDSRFAIGHNSYSKNSSGALCTGASVTVLKPDGTPDSRAVLGGSCPGQQPAVVLRGVMVTADGDVLAAGTVLEPSEGFVQEPFGGSDGFVVPVSRGSGGR